MQFEIDDTDESNSDPADPVSPGTTCFQDDRGWFCIGL